MEHPTKEREDGHRIQYAAYQKMGVRVSSTNLARVPLEAVDEKEEVKVSRHYLTLYWWPGECSEDALEGVAAPKDGRD